MNLEKTITKKINENFSPNFFKIINFSDKHKNHFLEDNNDTSHIKLIIVSKDFENLSKIDRERKVHKILSEEISKDIHSIRFKLYTLDEFQLVKR
jgi:BolA protein|tara:strand:- start:122 stop:406 length:285 start_codon:yes stop_codon:yes gene_type:complete